ncbi:MAG: Hpt domain-containing response regulator [Janthinobacterium lividum]
MDTDNETSQRILIVDDDEVMRELLSALLDVHGYEVMIADSGERALAMLADTNPPELILTDLQMPGLEGEALTTALRDAAPEHAMLLGMSGARPSPGTLRSLDTFLSKPFSVTQLQEAIQGARSARDRENLVKTTENPSPAAPLQATASESAESIFVPDENILDATIFAALSKSFRAEQLRELYTLTLDDVLQRHQRMLQHAASGDLAAVQREAHSVKGSCGFVGARELQILASAVEGGTTLNTAALAYFPEAVERLRRMLNAKLPQ